MFHYTHPINIPDAKNTEDSTTKEATIIIEQYTFASFAFCFFFSRFITNKTTFHTATARQKEVILLQSKLSEYLINTQRYNFLRQARSQLQSKLSEYLINTQDSVRFYPLCANC